MRPRGRGKTHRRATPTRCGCPHLKRGMGGSSCPLQLGVANKWGRLGETWERFRMTRNMLGET